MERNGRNLALAVFIAISFGLLLGWMRLAPSIVVLPEADQLDPLPPDPAPKTDEQTVGGGRPGEMFPRVDMHGLRDSQKLQEYIRRVQFPPDCTRARLAIHHPFNSGLGSVLNVMQAAFLAALLDNRTFVLRQGSLPPVNPNLCKKRNNDCYLLPISNCTLDHVLPGENITWVKKASDFKQERVVVYHRPPRSGRRPVDFLGKNSGLAHLYGEAWYAKEILQYLMQPNAKLVAHSEKLRRQIGLPPRYLAVHMRMGYNVPNWLMNAETKSKYPLSVWLVAIHHTCWLHRIRDVYVSSDDPALLGSIQNKSDLFYKAFLNKKANMIQSTPLSRRTDLWQAPRFYYIPPYQFPTMRAFKADKKMVLEKFVKSDMYMSMTGEDEDEAKVMLTNFLLLASGWHFIGALSSNVGRIIWQLMYRGDRLGNFFDMDNDMFWDDYSSRFRPERVRFKSKLGPTIEEALLSKPCRGNMAMMPGTNNCMSQIPGPGRSGPACAYGGLKGTAEECAALCVTKKCTSFVWHSETTGGWAKMCYYRTDGVWAPEPEPKHISGHCLSTLPNHDH